MALSFGQLTAITEKSYIPKLVDNVYNSSPVIKRMTQPGKLKLKTGGTSILAPVYASKPSAGGYYKDLDALSTSATDNMTAAEFAWKQLYESIRIPRSDILKNSGDAQKLSLIESKMKIAESNIVENLSVGLFSDGTAATGALTVDQITGFAALASASTTYGGIAVADMATWIAQVKDNSGTLRALSLNLMQQVDNLATFNGAKPTVLIGRKNVYDQYWSLLQPHQRLISQEMIGLGFKDIIEFNGKAFLADDHAVANTILFLDEENVYLAVHRDENMRAETLERLETSNSMLSRIFWMGNLISHSRRSNGYLKDIEVSA